MASRVCRHIFEGITLERIVEGLSYRAVFLE